MQTSRTHQISILKDFKRLKEVHELAYSSYFKNEENNKPADINLFPILDTSKNTKTIVVEIEDKIIGTNSLTIDGEFGLPSDKYFKEETDAIRKNTSGNVGNSWKIATSQDYKSNVMLLFDIIQKTSELAVEMKIDTCLYIFPKKHENIYKKMINAEKIAEKKCNIGDVKDVHLVLMKTETKNSIKHFKSLFTKRKFKND